MITRMFFVCIVIGGAWILRCFTSLCKVTDPASVSEKDLGEVKVTTMTEDNDPFNTRESDSIFSHQW